jgi:hypothetical protein
VDLAHEPPDPYEMLSDVDIEELDRRFWASMPEPTGEVVQLATITVKRPVIGHVRQTEDGMQKVRPHLRKMRVNVGDLAPAPVQERKKQRVARADITGETEYVEVDRPVRSELRGLFETTIRTHVREGMLTQEPYVSPPSVRERLKNDNVRAIGDAVLERAEADRDLHEWLWRFSASRSRTSDRDYKEFDGDEAQRRWHSYVNGNISVRQGGIPYPEDRIARQVYYLVAEYQNSWAGSTDNSLSRELQHSVTKLLGHGQVVTGERVFEEREATPMSDAIVQAMYERTQAFLREAGIERVRVWRGMGWMSSWADEWPSEAPQWARTLPVGPEVEVQGVLNPLSSWSADYNVASGSFGNIVLAAEVPATRILALPMTGIGCLDELEVVVIGGDEFEMTAKLT